MVRYCHEVFSDAGKTFLHSPFRSWNSWRICALWEEIIDQIPDEVFLRPNVKILSVGSGHGTESLVIAERMIDLGIPMNTINDSIFLLDKFFVFKSEVQARYGFKNAIQADFLEWESDMKFDVIVGNPPYADTGSSANSLWNRFIEKSFIHLKKNGVISFIVPQSLAFSQRYSSLRNTLHDMGLSKIKFLPDVIFNVGISVLYFITMKSDTTEIVDENGISYFTDKFFSSWMKNLMIHSIIEKIEKVHGKNYFTKSEFIFKDGCSVDEECDMVSLINGKIIKTERGNKRSRETDSDKLVSSYLPNDTIATKAIWFARRGISSGKYREMVVGSEEHGKSLESLFKTKLFSLIYLSTFSSRTLDGSQLRFLPHIKSTRIWTDQEIYQHFDLTQEEINLIEATVK